MSVRIIPREEVHAYSEACSDDPESYRPIATRLIRDQKRLARFIQENARALGTQDAEVALYMTTVCLRVFDRVGGRMTKVPGRDIDEAAARVRAVVESLLPADEHLPERVRAIEWRAQPHLLDEILWALYDRTADEEAVEQDAAEAGGETEKKEAVKPDPGRAALLFFVMWTLVEAMDANWNPPAGYEGGTYTGPVEVQVSKKEDAGTEA